MLIKIYNRQETEVLAEFDQIISIDTKEKLNSEISGSFEIPSDNSYITPTNLQLFNIVKIFDNNLDEVYKGFIIGVDIEIGKLKVIVNNENSIWSKKILYDEKNYSDGDKIKDIIQENLDDINNRQDTGYTLDCDLTDTISDDLKFLKGSKFIDLLNTLSKLGYEFITRNGKLEFKERIGEDKTDPSNSNYFKYTYKITSPTNNNINNIKGTLNGKNLYNCILGKSGANYSDKVDNTSKDKFGRIEKSFFVDGDLDNATQEELDKSKETILELSIDPQIINYNDLQIGDLVDCEIVGENHLLDYTGTVQLIEKRLKTDEGINFEYKVAPINKITKTFTERLNSIEDDVNKLLLK